MFKDISLNFLSNPTNGDFAVVKDENSIKQSFKNILLTDRFEIPFDSNFGGNINALLFELSTPGTVATLRERIILAIENYEPRVEILDVVVKDESDRNRYQVNIIYSTVLNEEPVTTRFFLERIQ